MPIIRTDRSYSFSDCFDFPNSTEDIVGELGYQFEFTKLTLPRAALPHPFITREVTSN